MSARKACSCGSCGECFRRDRKQPAPPDLAERIYVMLEARGALWRKSLADLAAIREEIERGR